MKQVRSFFSKWVACGIAIVVTTMALSAQAQQQEGTAKVQRITGTAEYADQTGTPFKKLTVGKILKSGAIIKTADDSVVDLFLRQNGPVLRVTPATTLGLDKLLFEETGTDTVIETKLNLSNGRILGNVKKLAAASKYECKTPVNTVAIRGTEFRISANGVVQCITGTVLVMYTPPGATAAIPIIVNAGETFIPAGVAADAGEITGAAPIPGAGGAQFGKTNDIFNSTITKEIQNSYDVSFPTPPMVPIVVTVKDTTAPLPPDPAGRDSYGDKK
jgi:hypothetical protein